MTAEVSPHLPELLTITEPAMRQIIHLLDDGSDTSRLRIDLRRSGCAGFGYTLSKLDESKPDDVVYHLDRITLHVSSRLVPLLQGTTVDYVQRGLNSEFRFSGPRMRDVCGCGKSFRLLDEQPTCDEDGEIRTKSG